MYKITIVNAQTGETITREMTDEENKVHLDLIEKQKNKIEKQKQAVIKREAAEAKLAALGLTADDLKALGL